MTTRFNRFKLEELKEMLTGLQTSIDTNCYLSEDTLNVIFPELEQEIKSRV